MTSERRSVIPGALLAALFVLALLPAAAGAQGAVPTEARVHAVVDSLARAFVADSQAPGVSIEVVRNGDTIVRGGWGLANIEEHVPATATTLYRIGSITKQFTSASVMRLVQAGKVSLGDSIATYVPNLPAAWRAVTVRELLNHTSGIPSYTDIGERWEHRWREDMPPDTLVALTASDSMWFAPGTKWRYDNSGYVVLGMLLDHVTGTPYPKFIEQNLLRPLGLNHTYYCDVHRILPQRAPGYERDGDHWAHSAFLSMTQPYSAGSLCSTVGDLARWNVLLATGHVVDSASYHAMTTPIGAAAAHHYGFGLVADTLNGHAIIEHGGGIMGFISANAYLPNDHLSVTVLANSGSAPSGHLLRQIIRASVGIPLVQPPKRVAISDAERQRYPGTYELTLPGGRAVRFTITDDGTALHAQLQGQDSFAMIPYGNDVFGAAFDQSLRMTFTVENGRATGFTLVQGGATIHARRVNGGT
ncbi:MAG TPA: serine hydrolase domain-containing protein [Gemmatimonadales bacterium]|nr:serine hydrolase domain-containing protein [Gemmatimonadales bacterium]